MVFNATLIRSRPSGYLARVCDYVDGDIISVVGVPFLLRNRRGHSRSLRDSTGTWFGVSPEITSNLHTGLRVALQQAGFPPTGGEYKTTDRKNGQHTQEYILVDYTSGSGVTFPDTILLQVKNDNLNYKPHILFRPR